jgi:hypothetical protein
LNFRFWDLSSVWQQPRRIKNLKSLLTKIDTFKSDGAGSRKAVHIMTHALAPVALPLLEDFTGRLVFLRIARNPCSRQLVYHYASWVKKWDDPKVNTTFLLDNKKSKEVDFAIPYFAAEFEELYKKSNDLEKAILLICNNLEESNYAIDNQEKRYSSQILEVCFEQFLIAPETYLPQFSYLFSSETCRVVEKELRKQKVPRQLSCIHNLDLEREKINREISNKVGKKFLSLLNESFENYRKRYNI